MRTITFLHVKSIKFNHSKLGILIIGSNILLLETKGVLSGKIRKTPLTYAKTKHGFIVAASNGGRDDIPNWFNNLQENDNYITVENIRFRVKHNLISSKEREHYWKLLISVYNTFEDYIERTKREIPLVEFIRV